MVKGDEQRLLQVFGNLLTNAAHHATGTPVIEVSLDKAGDKARVRVRDHGPGIPRDQIDKIFTRFHQVMTDRQAREGLGLGLFIAKGIVEQHGGAIRADSPPGQGATITVELPLAR